MNNHTDPTQRFLTSIIANALRIFLTPMYYVMRSDMGIQHSALAPVFVSACNYGAVGALFALSNEVDARVVILYAVLGTAGYIRNTLQARRRRRVRDWSVNSWSVGRSLLEPVFVILCQHLQRKGSNKPSTNRLVHTLLNPDFIYYIGEPVALVLVAAALWSIGSVLYFYPLLIAVALIFFRNDAQLSLYLRAHEVVDGQMVEKAIRGELDAPATGTGGTPVAEIPAAPVAAPANDEQSVLSRLSPDLQLLLARDRATQP